MGARPTTIRMWDGGVKPVARLSGKVAIVTGGGRGIGRAHAVALAEAGAAVLVNDFGASQFDGEGALTMEPAESVVAEIIAAGGQAVADGRDVSNWDEVGAIVDTAVGTFGRLDIVVNNAAIARGGAIHTLSALDWERSIAVNLTGAAAMTHWAGAYWLKQGAQAGRSIINTSSPVLIPPVPNGAPYVASKAGIATLTMTSALELAELGVRVNAIAPVARTRISQTMAPDLMKPINEGFDPMAPENVSALVVYLASPRCQITGRLLGVVGDRLFVYDSWTVAHGFDNEGAQWSDEALDAALGAVPLQQRVIGLGGHGPREQPAPSDAALEALDRIERRT